MVTSSYRQRPLPGGLSVHHFPRESEEIDGKIDVLDKRHKAYSIENKRNEK